MATPHLQGPESKCLLKSCPECLTYSTLVWPATASWTLKPSPSRVEFPVDNQMYSPGEGVPISHTFSFYFQKALFLFILFGGRIVLSANSLRGRNVCLCFTNRIKTQCACEFGIPHCTCLNYDNVFFFSHLSFFSLLHIYVSRLESEQPLVFSGSSSAIIFLTFLSLRIGAIRCCVDRTLKE